MTMIPDRIPDRPNHTDTVEIEHVQEPAPVYQVSEIQEVQPVPVYVHHVDRRRKVLAKWTQVITWAFVALEIALGFRVMLKLIAANPANPFTQFIYNLTQLFVAPFAGLTVTPGVSGAFLEISSLIGMIVYAVIYWLVIRLIWIIFNPTEPSDASRYDPDL